MKTVGHDLNKLAGEADMSKDRAKMAVLGAAHQAE